MDMLALGERPIGTSSECPSVTAAQICTFRENQIPPAVDGFLGCSTQECQQEWQQASPTAHVD